MTGYAVFILLGYLLGSVPFGLIFSRIIQGTDVRDYGSGRTGMTNVIRSLGLPAGIAVLLLDMGKAILAVLLARIFYDSYGVEVAAALAVIAGHNWPVFSGFRGGRGISPGWGGLLIISPLSGLVASVVGVSLIIIWRYMSVGSIVGASIGSVTLVVLGLIGVDPLEYAWYGLIATPVLIFRHKDNLQRLWRGEERKIGRPAEPTTPTQAKS